VAGFDSTATALDLWRAVEAQHRVSTMVLVDTLDEQALLEHILDDSKPVLPSAQRSLHYLLFTPFRYPPLPNGSRFRGPFDPGVFYGAEAIRTACAELGYWRWRLLRDSPRPPYLARRLTCANRRYRVAASSGLIPTTTRPARSLRATRVPMVSKSSVINRCAIRNPAPVLRS
jgi:hypothetical protein